MTGRRLVVFDMDGTLMDSQDIICAAMDRAFRAQGLTGPPRAKVLSIVGLSLELAIARLAPGLEAAGQAALVQGYRENFIALRAETGGEAAAPLYTGARAALDVLAARPDLLLGVATGKARRGLDHALAAHDLGRFFVTLQTADTHPSKPHPSMLRACLHETGVAAGRAVMIGDTQFDIAMGRAAGFQTIGVTWGYHAADDLRAAGADMLINRCADITGALDRLWDEVPA